MGQLLCARKSSCGAQVALSALSVGPVPLSSFCVRSTPVVKLWVGTCTLSLEPVLYVGSVLICQALGWDLYIVFCQSLSSESAMFLLQGFGSKNALLASLQPLADKRTASPQLFRLAAPGSKPTLVAVIIALSSLLFTPACLYHLALCGTTWSQHVSGFPLVLIWHYLLWHHLLWHFLLWHYMLWHTLLWKL